LKNPPEQRNLLKQSLSLLDATAVNIGAIIGAGIFVVTGIVAGQAGSALFVSIIIAGGVSLLTAMSFVELSASFPREGGAYKFASELVSHLAGFLSGWAWIAANILVGAAVALSFGNYSAAFLPGFPPKLAAGLLTAFLTLLNLLGAGSSARVNNILVAAKLMVLAFFIALGFRHINGANLSPFRPFTSGVFYGAYLIFFAFSGFARVTVVAGEVKNPRRNVPRAIMLSIFISTIIYIGVGFVAVGLVGPEKLGESSAPLTEAISAAGSSAASAVVSSGGLLATATVLLTTILGVSRMGYAMARDDCLPGILSRLNKGQSPYLAVILSGVLMVLLVIILDITSAVAVSTLAALFYYAMGNLAAFRLKSDNRKYPRLIPILGLATCLGLALFALVLKPAVWLAGAGVLIAGFVFYKVRRR
jgi:APA family basic amino acid/polyamine antiporter